MEFLDEYVQVRLTPTDKKKIKLNAERNKMNEQFTCTSEMKS